MKITLEQLMNESGVKFGTSGARGLVTALTDRVAWAYTLGFLRYLQAIGELPEPDARFPVVVGGDLRPSTPRIMDAALRAIADAGYQSINCGPLPSPALALHAFERRIPAVMVTGSHIPDDRNGLKFNKCSGEVLKDDEAAMTSQTVEIDDSLFDAVGAFRTPIGDSFPIRPEALPRYLARYVNAFPETALRGYRLGVYQHSAVGRDVITDLLRRLGAEVMALGRSDRFIPVDTEAIRDEDIQLARTWAAEMRLDAIVSADGDSDRPLVSDEQGEWLRGDVAGVLCARYLDADSVSTPVSSNTVVEKCGWFRDVRWTRIGSPYVIASMQAAAAAGAQRIVGYEANGGFLTNSSFSIDGRPLAPLPTRDAVIVMLGVLLLARREGRTVSGLAGTLPERFTASDRLKEIPTERSRSILARFSTGSSAADRTAVDRVFAAAFGAAQHLDFTDGVRVTFASGEILHLRPSGNAPEFRCYAEAASDARAREMITRGLAIVASITASPDPGRAPGPTPFPNV